MKSNLLRLTIAVIMALAINAQAQTSPATLGADIINDGFESWTGQVPNNWMKAPVTTISTAGVKQALPTGTLSASESGTYACNMQNTAASYTSGIMGGNPVSVTAGMGYQVSYYARGKGTITCEVTDGSAATSSANYNAANGQSVNGKTWHHFYQTVIAPTTTTNAQFVLKVKSTATYTATGGISITGIDVDSFVVRPYTPVALASLYDIEYTTATNGNSPFYAQYVGKTGGIVTDVIYGSTGRTGYYVQTSGSNSWAAALVFDQAAADSAHRGDSITFGCSVDEYFNMTELVSITNFTKVSSGHLVPAPVSLNTQTMADEQYEGMLVTVNNMSVTTIQTYSANYGQATGADASAVPGTFDLKNGFYPPNGSATAGSGGLPGYTVTVGANYCFTGNINYEFNVFNLVPRDSSDIIKNATSCLTGIDTYKNNLHAKVFPNPTTNVLNIELPYEAHKINVSLTDVLGNVVLSNTTSGSLVNVNTVNLSAGVYMVRIVADGKTQITKVIKD
jgi:predicted extracellular nuclease